MGPIPHLSGSFLSVPSPNQASRRILLWGDSITEGKPGSSYALRLSRRFPDWEFVNRGKGGDTVQSLARRMKTEAEPETPYDLALLWVGVNDVYADITPVYGLWKTAMRQQPTRDEETFTATYRSVVHSLGKQSRRLLLLPPLFIGEDPTSVLNHRIMNISGIIRGIAEETEGCRFVDVRSRLPLSSHEPPVFLPLNPLSKLADTIAGMEDEYFDRAADRRGLTWTCDGVHLNSRGAETVAEVLETELVSAFGRTNNEP